MTRRITLAVIASLCLSVIGGPAIAVGPPVFSPGAPGAGDDYFPGDGNGGYDVQHYLLDVSYDPDTDVLTGVATITARATQNLSAFNLDLDDALSVSAVSVNDAEAAFAHVGDELVITPQRGIRNNNRFTVVVTYGGVPQTINDLFGLSGFIHTEDGALVIGQPHVAATWFPANDHPSDRAAFTFIVTVPEGLEAVANGALIGQTTSAGWTSWEWDAPDPMATYLAGMSIGQLEIDAYRVDRIQYWDAIDPQLLGPVATPIGEQLAMSQQADSSYKRLLRQITVPADGATLTFQVTRSTEEFWDFFFVEAHPVGSDDWSTLPDLEGHATQETGASCLSWYTIHPFIAHYQTPPADELSPCTPSGTTGEWWAATGASDGWETWTIDLDAYAGMTVEVSLTYASDDVIQANGVFVDDIVVSTGEGSTGFEDDGDLLDGWTVPGAPGGSPGNDNDWIVVGAADVPLREGAVARESLAHQDQIISFLEETFGPYPFGVAGGIVDEAPIFFALENQTRPIYSKVFFTDTFSGDLVIVHELAHQWFGDSLTIEQWQHIWLNEGFATYAEWMWLEEIGFDSVQGSFDFWYDAIPAEATEFWGLTIGDPGPEHLFDFAIYTRGAMTLHQLRLAVGDDAFFKTLEQWARLQAGDTVTTDEFVALAEKVSGQQLDDLFNTWLFTAGKPVVGTAAIGELRIAGTAAPSVWAHLRSLDEMRRK